MEKWFGSPKGTLLRPGPLRIWKGDPFSILLTGPGEPVEWIESSETTHNIRWFYPMPIADKGLDQQRPNREAAKPTSHTFDLEVGPWVNPDSDDIARSGRATVFG